MNIYELVNVTSRCSIMSDSYVTTRRTIMHEIVIETRRCSIMDDIVM